MNAANLIGRLMYDQRIQRGLTQEEVAEVLGIKQSTYANYESGNRLIPAKYVAKLSSRLNFNVSEIAELHPKLDSEHYLAQFADYDEEPIIIQGKGVVVAVPINPHLQQNPIISYLASEGYNLIINDPPEDYLSIRTEDYEMSLSQKELETLKKNVTNYIEFELYKKRNQ